MAIILLIIGIIWAKLSPPIEKHPLMKIINDVENLTKEKFPLIYDTYSGGCRVDQALPDNNYKYYFASI